MLVSQSRILHSKGQRQHLKRAGSSQLSGSPIELSQAECRCLGGALGGITANRVSAYHLHVREYNASS